MGLCFLFLLPIFVLTSKGVTIGLLSQGTFESLSRLHYRGGDCDWRISGLVGGLPLTATGPHIDLEALGTGVEITCEVNGTTLLQVVIITHDRVPPPHNVNLDTINKRLQWDHPFLPQLPPLFELVYEFTITFQVYGKKDGVHEPSLSGPVSKTYFDLTSESDYCAEYDFVVQALINISYEHPGQNSSSVSGYFTDVPSFRNLSVVAHPTPQQQYLAIRITFVLEDEDCPGTHPTFFIVILEGISEHKFDINSTHIDDGGGVFLIQITDSVHNTCHLEGTVFGGNDAGNCTACIIQLSKCSYFSSVVMPTGTSSTAMDPSSSPFPSPDGNMLLYTIGAVAGGTTLSIAVIVLGVAVVLVCAKRHKKGHHLDPPVQTNQAYVTVVRSSGKIKTQPCPAYELAVIES